MISQRTENSPAGVTRQYLNIGLRWGLWLAALYGALSISNTTGDWGHSLCGPWGCGPPLQALLGCHLAWLVGLMPIALECGPLRRMSSQQYKLLGLGFVALGLLMVLAAVAYERIYWWQEVSQDLQQYFWQRCGFAIATNIDLPMLQMIILGAIMSFCSWIKGKAGAVAID